MCFTMGGSLERFSRMRYRELPRVTIRYTTDFTILLREFCTVSNALLADYYIDYCMPYYTFSVK